MVFIPPKWARPFENRSAALMIVMMILQLASCQIPYQPVNVTELDPLGTCNRFYTRVAVSKDKVYFYGGTSVVRNGTEPNYGILNDYLRIADFTESRDLATDQIMDYQLVPAYVPVMRNVAFWADDNNLYATGGESEGYPYVNEYGQWESRNGSQQNIGSSIWQYTVATQQWQVQAALQPVSGPGVTDIVSYASYAWDEYRSIGYAYGGGNYGGTYGLYEGSPAWFSSNSIVTDKRALLSLDTATLSWTNDTAPLPLLEVGQMIAFPHVGDGGILVLIGGMLKYSNQLASMRQVSVYDVAAQKWYNQTTTAENDIFPLARCDFCAVGVSAADGSSHNVFIYGGYPNFQTATGNALDDVFVLTLPSFHWISVGQTGVPRQQLACTLLADRYILTYGGRSLLADDGTSIVNETCDDLHDGLRLYDLQILDWATKYEAPATGTAANTSNFVVPSKIFNVIGGGPSGHATMTQPATGFDSPALGAVFAAVKSSNNTTTSGSPSSSPSGSSGGGTSSHTGAIAGGVIGGVVLIALIVGGIILLRRKKGRDSKKPSADGHHYQRPGEKKELSGESSWRGHELDESEQQKHRVYEVPGDYAQEMPAAADTPHRQEVP